MELKQGDCLELMRDLKDESVDSIITDPPYFIPSRHYETRERFRRNLVDLYLVESFFKNVFKEFERILKKEGTIYLFCDGQSYPLFWVHLYPYCKSVRPLIWDKKTSINGYSWRHQHELILFAEMPQAKPIPSGDGDILRYSATKVKDKKHPAEKPIELLEQLIKKSTKEYDIICDPFMGSGTTGIACQHLNRNFIGYELSPEYFKVAQERIEGETKQSLLSTLKSGVSETAIQEKSRTSPFGFPRIKTSRPFGKGRGL